MDHYYFTYYVVYKSNDLNRDGPILTYSSTSEMKAAHSRTMHLFDEELLETLAAVEYLMHLPRNIFDVYDMGEHMMGSSYDTPHYIIVLPDLLLSAFWPSFHPTMFVLTDDCGSEVKQRCEAYAPYLGVFNVQGLNEKLLKDLWMKLWQMCRTEDEEIVRDIEVQHILHGEYLKALPALFYSRQFGQADQFLSKIYNSHSIEQDCVTAQWHNMAHLGTLLLLQSQGVTEHTLTKQVYTAAHEKASAEVGLSVVITLPGVAKQQKKFGLNSETLSKDEQRIIRILGVHRAIARGGVLIELPCLNDALFQKYNELEQRCKDGTNNKYVWRAMTSLGRQLSNYFNDYQRQVLRMAKDITVFSDFPVGITILEGDEVPLQCYKSISYRPLTPLTRCYQGELLRSNQWYLGDHCKVVMAECIPDDDENRFVYRMSEEVYDVLKDHQQKYPNFTVIHEKINTVKQMRNLIENHLDADILYISAHGHYDSRRNMAGIVVGTEFWMANENFHVPPVVILSACHTSPRGIGAVTIADLFLRNGALAVLGSFIPVDAHRNLILMTRLFTYIAEAQKKYDKYRTLADAWSGIVATNAIHELMKESPNFQAWMYSKNKRGKIRAVEFQLERCVNRLRSSHIYSDTIQIIKEMLEEEGMQGRFGNILDQNDYFPESCFYQFLGSPENVFLFNEIFDQYCQKHGIAGYLPFSGNGPSERI